MEDSDDDISIVSVVPTKSKGKAASWVTSSFDDFEFGPKHASVSQTKTAKARRTLSESQPQSSQSQSRLQSRKKVQMTLSNSVRNQEPVCSQDASKKRQRDGDDTILPAHKIPSVVKSDSQRRKLKSALSTDLWSDKYQPKRKEELAVHKKKVEDIYLWLKDRTKGFPKGAAPVLLLTGPPGSGKTVAIRTIAAELQLEVQEWSNPATAGGDSDFRTVSQADWTERSSVDVYSSQSQSSLFSNYLLRANKYHALQLGPSFSGPPTDNNTQGKIILVEDIPNAFYRDPSELHSILRKYRRCGHCPLVFIVSDESSNSSSIQRLCPPDVQEELRIESINVNPVAPTMMVKVLNNIASKEAAQGHFVTPSAKVVESIAMSSAGDVRSAVNALQFACRQDTMDLNQMRMVQKRARKEKSGAGRRLKYGSLAKQDSGSAGCAQTQVIGAKDTTCFLFHALGKILYFKRGDPAQTSDHKMLPAHLNEHDRDPLLLTPEEIVEKTHMSGEYFNSFLHQNYVDFLSSIEDVDRASEYLSQADQLTAQYSNRGQLQDYSISVATRGFIHSDSSISRHTDSRKGHGWRPLHKSQWFAAVKQSQQSKASAMKLFRGYHWDPEILLTEIIPYINLTNPTLHDPDKLADDAEAKDALRLLSESNALRKKAKARQADVDKLEKEISKEMECLKDALAGLEKLDEKTAVSDDEETGEISSPAVPSSTARISSTTALSRKDNGGDGDDDDLPSSQTTVKTVPAELEEEQEEECVIEEFDD